MAADNKKIAKNSIYMYIRMGVTILVGFYTSRVILQVLGVQDYGIYNAVGGIVALFTFLNTAMTEATQRFLSYELGKGDKVQLRNTFSMCLNVHMIISMIIVLFCEIIGLWLFYHKMVIPSDRQNIAFWVFQLSVITSVLNVTQVPYNASLFAHEKFNVYAVFQIGKTVLQLLFVIALQFIPFDKLLVYAILVFICNLTFVLLNRLYDIRMFEECHYIRYWDNHLFKQVMGYTSWSLVGNLSNTLSDQGINILLNMFFGPIVNAARGIAMQVQTAVASLVFNFQGASIPQIVKLYASGDREAAIKLVNNSSKISFYFFYILVVPVCFEMHQLLHIWLGHVHDYMVSFSILTLLSILCAAFGGTLGFLIQATGKIRRFQLFISIANITIFVASYLFLKLGFPPYSPLIITIVMKLVIDLYTYFEIRRLMDYPIMSYFKSFLFPSLIVSVLGLVVPGLWYLCLPEDLLRCILLISTTITINALIIFFVGFKHHERIWIIHLLRGVLSSRIKKELN